MVRKVVFVEQFFYPDGWSGTELPRDLTVSLSQAGYAVEAICGSDQYAPVERDRGLNPSEHGVKIRRIPSPFRAHDIKNKKFLRQIWFYLAAFPLLLFRRRPAIFIAQTNPPLMVILVRIAAAVHRRPYILIAMDLYPEVIFSHKVVREESTIGRVLTRFFSWAYRGANRVVALGPTMRARLETKGVESSQIEVISNWATGDTRIVRGKDNRFLGEWNLNGLDVILYSGNLGIAHDVETPIRALDFARKKNPKLRLLFIGQGSRLEEAKRLVDDLRLSEFVIFKPLVPVEMLPESLGVAKASLVTLKPGFEGLVVPSKLLGYMARGMPTLYIGPPSDVQTILEESGGGVTFANSDHEGIADFMANAVRNSGQLQEMGLSASRYYERHLSKEVGLQKYRELVSSALL